MFRLNCIRLGKDICCFSNPISVNINYRTSCIYNKFSTKPSSEVIIEKSSKNNENMLPFLNAASKIGLDKSYINDVIKSEFISSNINSDQFVKNSKTLFDFGFSQDSVVEFIKGCPSLFLIKNSELERLLSLWQEFEISEDLLIELLSTLPQLIEIIGPTVLKRAGYLLPYFQTHKVLVTLFLNSPGVIYENWGTLKAKLDFLHSHNIPMKHVARCNALDLDILEIKTRFKFLERAGVYKKVIDLEKKKTTVKNATIRNILCTNDELFAHTIAKLSLVEYEAFIELYKLEYELEDNEEESE